MRLPEITTLQLDNEDDFRDTFGYESIDRTAIRRHFQYQNYFHMNKSEALVSRMKISVLSN